MTLWEMDAAIAQHLGWKDVHVYEDDAGPPIHCGTPPGPASRSTRIPRYSEDLNAMAEAENAVLGPRYYETLKDNQLAINYWLEIRRLVLRPHPGGGTTCSEIDKVRATAPQRAEALTRAIGKWRDA